MAKPFTVDITADNTPIRKDAKPEGKKGGCGGRGGCTCGGGKQVQGEHIHLEPEKGRTAQMILLAVIVIGAAVCFFYFS